MVTNPIGIARLIPLLIVSALFVRAEIQVVREVHAGEKAPPPKTTPKRVAVISAEVGDIFATGGMGPAVLRYAQASNATEGASTVTLVMPYYTHPDMSPEEQAKVVDTGEKIHVDVDYKRLSLLSTTMFPQRSETFSVLSYRKGNTEVILLRHEPKKGEANLFENTRVKGQTKTYSRPEVMGKAFATFDKAAAQYVTEKRFDIANAADWTAGWTNVLLHQAEAGGEHVPRRVQWVHNLLYKGIEHNSKEMFAYLGLDEATYRPLVGHWPFRANPLKGAANTSDLTMVVSTEYSREITSARMGAGMEDTMRAIQSEGRLTGRINGIDNEEWTPKDFTPNDLSGKWAGKRALQAQLGLPLEADVPLIAMTCRITKQKGFDYSIAALREFLTHNSAQVVIVADADPGYVEKMKALAADPKLKDKIRWLPFSKADEREALMYSDGFLLPSEMEPSGLNQMYALRTGAVPIVTDVGGLKETIIPGKNGFVIPIVLKKNGKWIDNERTQKAVVEGLESFVDTYRNRPAQLARLRKNGMLEDNSWSNRIAEYEAAYQYVQEGGSLLLKDSGHDLAGLKPSQLLELSRKVRAEAVRLRVERCLDEVGRML